MDGDKKDFKNEFKYKLCKTNFFKKLNAHVFKKISLNKSNHKKNYANSVKKFNIRDFKNASKSGLKSSLTYMSTASPIYSYYNIGFLILSIILLISIKVGGKSLIYNADAYVQHFQVQYALESAFRNPLYYIFVAYPSFNFNLGLGSDPLTTFHHYGFTDPLNLLLMILRIFPSEVTYTIMYLLRIYLSGLAFIYMCKKLNLMGIDGGEVFGYGRHKEQLIDVDFSPVSIILGGLIYAFSNYNLSTGIMHPFFISNMYIFPLMVVAINELIFENKIMKLILIIVLSVLTNFYFAFMIALMGFVYALSIIIYNNLYSKIKTGIISYLLGLSISAVVLIPIVYALFTSNRAGGSISGEVFSDISYIKTLFRTAFSFPNIDKTSQIRISLFVLPSLLVFLFRRKNSRLKVLLLICLLAMCSPVVQSIITGFSYPNHRWTFCIYLLLSYIFVVEADFVIEFFRGVYKFINVTIYRITKKKRRRPRYDTYLSLVLVFFMLFTSAGIIKMSTDAVNRRKLTPKEDIARVVKNPALKEMGKELNKSFFRLDNSFAYGVNQSNTYKYPSTSIYYSLENKSLVDFNLAMKNAKASPITRFNGVDSRFPLEQMLSVKYFYGKTGVPKNFILNDERDGSYSYLYKNRMPQPFGYTYDDFLYEMELDNKPTLIKQATMSRTAIIDKKPEKISHISFKERAKIENIVSDVDYEIKEKKPFSGYAGYNIKIYPEVKKPGELYLTIRDQETFKWAKTLYVKNEGKRSTLEMQTPKDRYYAGEIGKVVNLGEFKPTSSEYLDKIRQIIKSQDNKDENNLNVNSDNIHSNGRGEINDKISQSNNDKNKNKSEFEDREIIINVPEYFELDPADISIKHSDTNKIEANFIKLGKESLKNIKVKNRGFTGNIETNKPKLLFISIPYEKHGWKAYVNGLKTQIYKANYGFMAIEVPEGKSDIKFKYKRPGQTVGVLVTVAGIFFTIRYKNLVKK